MSGARGRGNQGTAARPRQNTWFQEFNFKVAKLHKKTLEEGTYASLLRDIHLGVVERAQWESNHPDESKLIHPFTVEGKHVLPRSSELFVVRVTSTTEEESICYLYEWCSLYCGAFYVETKVKENQCWYIFKDFAKINLPPADQFPYVNCKGVGFHILSVYSSYAGVGRKGIRLGKGAIDGYIKALFNIRASLLVGGKLNLTKALKEKLTNGPFSFGVVAISEPSRFAEYQDFMLKNISADVHVPKRFTQFFNHWSALCCGIKDGDDEFLFTYTDEQTYQKVEIRITLEQLKAKISLMCSKVITHKKAA